MERLGAVLGGGKQRTLGSCTKIPYGGIEGWEKVRCWRLTHCVHGIVNADRRNGNIDGQFIGGDMKGG